MRNTVLSSVTSLLVPFAAYGAHTSYGAYQRKSVARGVSGMTASASMPPEWRIKSPEKTEADALFIHSGTAVRELVILDTNVQDKHLILKQAKPGVDIVEIKIADDGVAALIQALAGYKNLQAVHIVAHAEAGVMYLGGHRIDKQTLLENIPGFAAINQSLRKGGDLLLYGCDLAKGPAGEDFLDILQQNTHVDIAASNDLTGNLDFGGNWELEIQKGEIETAVLADSVALQDFSGVLFTGTINFSQTKNAGDYYGNATVNAEVWATGTSGYFLIIDGLNRATELYTGVGSSGQAAFTLNTETSVTLRFNNNEPFSPQSLRVANIAGGGGTTHSFTFTSNKGSFAQNVVNGSPATVDLTSFGANVTYITISSTLVYAWMDDFSVVGVGITVDENPPVFQNSTPSVGSLTLSGATLSADLDEEGTVYYVVVADGASAPSVTQVRNGQNSSGAAALASGNFTTTSTTGNEAFSGLSSGTNYDLYVVAQDDESTPNVQASVTLVNFTTQAADSDATLTVAGGISEPVGLATTIDTVGEAVNLFDFTISDGGTSDGLATTVSQVIVNVSGTSTDAERSKITWRLNGPDVSNVTGTYNAGTDTITFSSLSISVANGGNETYTVNAYYNDNTVVTEDRTVILNVNGDDDLTVGAGGTQMSGGNVDITNGAGTTIDVVATQLAFTTQPAGSVSDSALTTQPVVAARDAFGNTDVDFTETITLTEASAGTLSNNTQAATNGVATFTNLIYAATADQESFTLTANDQDGVGSDLPTVDANAVTSDVVASQLVFETQPAPTSVISGQNTAFTTVPVVSARDANSIVDTGYATDITLAEVNGAGSATMTATGDTDGSAATVSLTPSSGVATFTAMEITYTNIGASETFNLRASSGGLTTADSSQFSSATTPTVTDANIGVSGATGTGGAYKIGDTVTATWNNTGGGDNNSDVTGVTVDFSQFGGGAAVVASNSSDTWTATYTIVSGAIDVANRNVSVTATNSGGDTTTADTTNATVDNVAPTVTDVNISISGATGIGGAYKIGDTVTATWNNTAGGDNNSDTISGATVNFSAFGGGAAVVATNSSGTWTATYTITAGAIDVGNRNVSVTATDNAGNTRSTADTTNATVDSVAPIVSNVYISISGASGAGGAYIVGDTVTASWDNSVIGDDNSDTISGVTIDFSQFGGGAAVVATNSSGTWTATYSIVAGAIDATNRNVSVTATDNAGNTTTTADTTNATVDNIAPTVSSVGVPANATYIAGQNLNFTVNTSQTITVDTGGGTPRIALTLGAATVYASYISGSGSSALTFRYTVQAGDLDTNGIAVGAAIEPNGGSLGDASGNNLTLTLNAVGNTTSVLVDAVPPAAPTSLNLTAGSDSGSSATDDLTNDTTPTITGSAEANSTVTLYDSDGTTALVTSTANGIGNWLMTSSALADGAHSVTAKATDAAGNESVASAALVVTIDTTAPTVASVSVPANATYIVGQNLDFTVNADENVTVNTTGGTPQIALTVGATTRQATYVSGSGTSAVVFRYTLQAGDSDTDGIAVAASIDPNGGTLRDGAGNDLNTTLNAVGATTSILVDAIVPTVSSVSVPANSTYIAGQNLDFTVNTDENITVNTGGGTPRIAVTIGATSRYATYLSGSGTSAVVFRYTAQAGDNDTDGVAVAGTIDANGGTLQDSSGNNLNTTLNSVGATTSVLVDAVAPTVSSVSVPANATYIADQNLDFTVNTGENVTVNTGGGTPRIELTIGATTRYATYLSGSGTSALVFRYTVQTGDNDSDGVAMAVSIDANGGTLRDGAGNDMNTTLNSVGATTSVLVDAVAPTVSSVSVPANATYSAGQNLDFTVNASENVTVNSGGGTPRIELTIGAATRYATYLSGSGTSALVFRYTVQLGDDDSDGIAVAASLDTNGGTLRDGVGNDLNTALNSVGSTTSVLVDAVAPTVSSVGVPSNGTYTTGQNLDFTVNTDENVTVDTGGGTPQISLTIGATTRQVTYLSGSGTSAIVFRYTVQAGDSDTDGISIAASIDLNGGALRDSGGNNLNTTLNSVGSTASVLVDAVTPTVGSVSVPSNGTYTAGQNLDFTINTTENVTVNTGGGTPRVALTIGATTRYASYLSGSGSSALILRYTVQAGDNDTDGIAVAAAIDGNGGTLRDGAGNDLNTTLNSVGSTVSILVDTQAPTLDSSTPADNATNVLFDADLVLNFSENISAGAGSLSVYDAADDSLVENFSAASLAIAADLVTIDLSSNLTPTRSYYLQVANNAFADGAGNNYAGITDETTLNFTVGNNAPVSNDDSDTTNEDNAVAVDVLANDSDSDSNLNAASTAIVTAPANGSTSINTINGVITYTPSANFNGSDSFTYTVEDVFGALSNTATVTITVNAVNDAPVAVNDMTTTPEDNPLAIDVAANDTDVDASDSVDPVTITIVTAPTNGSAVVNAGQVDYAPAANFNGSDSFTYTVEDQNGATSNTATVIINVTGVNDLPFANDESTVVDEDDFVVVDQLANDSDLDGTLDVTTVMVMANPTNGSTSVDAATGMITYTPNANYFGSDSFTYVVQDNDGGTSNAATVTLSVISINDAPIAANDVAVLQEDTALEINVLGNDSDVDGTVVPASVQVVSASADGGTSINISTGAITYTPGADFFGTDTFTYRVQDNDGAWSIPGTVTITVNGLNDVPVASDDSVSTDEDNAVVINILANDIDVDDGLDSTSVLIVNNVSNGNLVNNGDGTVTYTPNANFNGSDSFTYEVDDVGGVTSNTAAVTITVNPVNDAPTISGTPAPSVSAGNAYSFTPTAADVESQTLTFSALNLPTWASLNTATGVMSGTPGRNDEGVHGNIVLRVNDGVDTTSLASFAIEVLHNDSLDTDNDGIPDDVELSNGLDPDEFNDGAADVDGDGVSNVNEYIAGSNIQTDDYPPVFTTLDPIVVNATGLLTRLPTLTVPQAVDALDGTVNASLVSSRELFAPGIHTLTWAAVDAAGNRAETTQQVILHPQISLGKDQVRSEGSVAMVRFLLNGAAPVYPLTVGYTLSGTADSNDHNLQAGTVQFLNGETEQNILLTIADDGLTEGTETLRINLDAATTTNGAANFGVKRNHDIQIVEQNVAPTLNLSLRQNGREARIITQTDGVITFTATVDDPNPGDTHQYAWTFPSISANNVSDSVKTIDVATLAEGVYRVSLRVTDSNAVPLSTNNGISFQVIAAVPTLSNASDSDDDGIDDESEGFGDSDGDGQPDYLDAIPLPNVLNEQAGDNGSFLLEADPGIRLSLGEIALQNGADGAHLSENELADTPDEEFFNVGGFFNITASEVPESGASVNIVIPQRAVIPANPFYRKLINGSWFNFIENANNSLASASGEQGLCPPPGSDDYGPGLTPGYWCVQITIEDGGPNDADGEANGTVEDPGGVSQNLAVATNTRVKGGGAVGWEIILLLLIPLLRYRRTLIVVSTLVVAAQTQADGLDNWYLQAALGQANATWSVEDFENRLDDISQSGNVSSFDSSRTTFDFIAGFQFKPWLAIEGGYLDWGEVDLQVDATTTNPAALEQLLRDKYPRSGEGPYLGLGINHTAVIDSLPITFFFKTGIWFWESDYRITINNTREKITQDGSDVMVGIGFSAPLHQRFDAGLMLQQVRLDGDRQLQTAIHLTYKLQ